MRPSLEARCSVSCPILSVHLWAHWLEGTRAGRFSCSGRPPPPPPPAPPPACRDPGRSLPPISSINSPPRVRIDFLLSVSIAARIDRDLGAGFVLFHHDFSLMLICMSIDPELEWPAASRSRSSPPGCRDRRAASALARLLLLGPPLRSSSSPVPRYVRDSVARPTNWGGFFLEFLLSPLLVMDEISEFFLGDEHLP